MTDLLNEILDTIDAHLDFDSLEMLDLDSLEMREGKYNCREILSESIAPILRRMAAQPQPTGDILGRLDELSRVVTGDALEETMVEGLRTAVAALQGEARLERKMLADKCDQHMETETKVLELQRRVADGERDTARLDAMLATATGIVIIDRTSDDEEDWAMLHTREAIDDAMKEQTDAD